MNKEKLIDELLELHCQGCEGDNYGCVGCCIRDDIKEIVLKALN